MTAGDDLCAAIGAHPSLSVVVWERALLDLNASLGAALLAGPSQLTVLDVELGHHGVLEELPWPSTLRCLRLSGGAASPSFVSALAPPGWALGENGPGSASAASREQLMPDLEALCVGFIFDRTVSALAALAASKRIVFWVIKCQHTIGALERTGHEIRDWSCSVDWRGTASPPGCNASGELPARSRGPLMVGGSGCLFLC